MALLQLESLKQDVDVVVPDLRNHGLVRVYPHFPHARFFAHAGLPVEPAEFEPRRGGLHATWQENAS